LLMVSRDEGSRTCSNFICHHCKARESRELPKPASAEVHLPTVLSNRNTR
jgi:predicted CxxxxCH...CXXCH cytochrome family protein